MLQEFLKDYDGDGYNSEEADMPCEYRIPSDLRKRAEAAVWGLDFPVQGYGREVRAASTISLDYEDQADVELEG